MYKIAIDGPSGAGKSTLAKEIAAKLGYVYVDTGALYRTVGLYMYRNHIDPQNAPDVIGALSSIRVRVAYEQGTQHVYLNDEDVSEAIREHEISRYASLVSAVPEVRAFLLDLQRDIAKENSVVMDGRDIGTVIFPDAQVKIFLVANDETRAMRRCRELKEKGQTVAYETVLHDIRERDAQDRNREIAPAVAAPDAVVLDNSGMDLEQCTQAALAIIKEKLHE